MLKVFFKVKKNPNPQLKTKPRIPKTRITHHAPRKPRNTNHESRTPDHTKKNPGK